MKKLFIFVFIIVLLAPTFALAYGSHSVGGHIRKNGSYVAPHYRTNRDKTKLNNYSTKGNYNPYTGKKGTKNPW